MYTVIRGSTNTKSLERARLFQTGRKLDKLPRGKGKGNMLFAMWNFRFLQFSMWEVFVHFVRATSCGLVVVAGGGRRREWRLGGGKKEREENEKKMRAGKAALAARP